jgi:YegS/Rv2252/BmrU family lipid kinase
MKVVFIFNNKKNRLAGLIPRLDQHCREMNLGAAEFIPTLWARHAIELAKQATDKGCDYLISVGGDGTLNEVLNGVLKSKIPTNEYPVLGVLPCGSANDFARTAHVSNSIEELSNLIQSGSTKTIDLGKIIIHGTREPRYFINIAGAGLSPEVVRNLEGTTSVFGPGFNYFRQIVKGFLNYAKKDVTCTSSEWRWSGKLLQMAVANGRCFGNAICVAPDARLTDGQFQVAVFGDLSIWDYLKNLGRLKRGLKISHPEVVYHTTEEVVLESTNSCGIEADGEYVGLAPATISMMPEAIRFLMPLDVM